MRAFLEAGRVLTTHGVAGELKVEPWCDSVGVFCRLTRLFVPADPALPGDPSDRGSLAPPRAGDPPRSEASALGAPSGAPFPGNAESARGASNSENSDIPINSSAPRNMGSPSISENTGVWGSEGNTGVSGNAGNSGVPKDASDAENARNAGDPADLATSYRLLSPVAARAFGRFALLRLPGVRSLEEALPWTGRVLFAAREDIPLPPGAVFRADLPGLPVIDADSGRVYGKIADVLDGAASELYEIDTGAGRVLLPAVRAFVLSVDIDRGVLIRPIPGFFDEE